MKLKLILSFCIIYWCIFPVQAHFMEDYIENPSSEIGFEGIGTIGGQNFLSPNEFTPQDSAPIMKDSETGLHLSVGTERGFIGFALNPNATHYLAVDGDPQVPIFNRLKIALFHISKNMEDLKHLTLDASLSELIERADSQIDPPLHPQFRKEFTSENFNTFRDTHKQNNHKIFFRPPEYQVKFANGQNSFQGTSYFYNQNIYDRLKTAAHKGRMYAIQLNLTDHIRLQELVGIFTEKEIKLSVIDISNAWQRINSYLGDRTSTLISYLSPMTSPKSMLIMTIPPVQRLLNESNLEAYHANYIGLHWESIEESIPYLYKNYELLNQNRDHLKSGIYGPKQWSKCLEIIGRE